MVWLIIIGPLLFQHIYYENKHYRLPDNGMLNY